jgi:hypothetical protein
MNPTAIFFSPDPSDLPAAGGDGEGIRAGELLPTGVPVGSGAGSVSLPGTPAGSGILLPH